MSETSPLLDVRKVSKTFPGNQALIDVSLRVGKGEIVALLGPNGSGKSTLVKILAGVYEADPGAELGHGEAGTELHFIHQELGLIPMLTTVENLDLARQLERRGLRPVHGREEARRARELVARFGGEIEVTVPVEELSAAERSVIAIARAFDGWRGDRNVLVLDEPTAALHGDEVGRLFAGVRALAGHGAGIIFISHRLDEVLELADRVVVLRDGHVVADASRSELDHDRLVRLIAGAEVASSPRARRLRDERVLEVQGLTTAGVAGLDFDVAAGEIVGISGVLGSGRDEVASAIFGAIDREGVVRVGDQQLEPLRPREAIAAGLAFVPGDRRRLGAVMSLNARENITLPRLSPLRRRFGRISGGRERREVHGLVDSFDVRPRNVEQRLDQFSGGNQQKVVLAKWLRNGPRTLLLDEPTQGVDVSGKAAIYKMMADAAAKGAGVVVASSDAEELVEVCDRVLVLRDGRLAATLEGGELTEARLLREGMASHVPGPDAGADSETEVHVG